MAKIRSDLIMLKDHLINAKITLIIELPISQFLEMYQ
jgi:hypothetical protein